MTKIRKKYPYFSLSILYLYESPISPPPFHIWDISYVYIPRTTDDSKWNVGHEQLKGDFPWEYEIILETSRNICKQPETVQKPVKLEETLNKASVEIKKLLNEIGDLNRMNISQQSYFSYDILNLWKEIFVSELDKKISVYGSISYFEEIKEKNQANFITPNNKLKFSVKENIYKEEIVL